MKSEGGTSLFGDEDIPNFTLVSSGVTEAGVGDFDLISLRKMLAGKSMRVSPSVGSTGQSINGTYGVRVDFDLDKDDRPNATFKISYNADPKRYDELNPIIYQQLQHIAERGPLQSSMDKVKQYLTKQYAQMAITNDYWNYVIWHELDDDVDFDRDYCTMVENMTASDVQQMAARLLAAKRCIEVSMLSE